MNNKEAYILGQERVRRAFWYLALPALLTMLAKAIYSAVDAVYIGLLRNSDALAAIGITSPLVLILQSFETVLGQGICVAVGRRLGKRANKEADNIVSTSFVFSVIFGAAVCALGIVFLSPAMRLFGASGDVLPYARKYSLWIFIGMIFNMPASCLNNAARGESAMRVPSTAMLIGTLLNVALDPVFIFDFGLGLGIEGASMATTISQAISLGFVLR